MSYKGDWSAKSFLGRRKSSQNYSTQSSSFESEKRRSSIFGKKKFSSPTLMPSQSNGVTQHEIEACMSRIRQQLDGLRLQRTDMQRRVEDMNTTLNEIRGECATRISLSGSISDLSSIGSFISMSDESSVSGLSQCYLVDDDESSGVDCDFDDDDDASECASDSSTETVSASLDEEENRLNLLEVTQTEYL